VSGLANNFCEKSLERQVSESYALLLCTMNNSDVLTVQNLVAAAAAAVVIVVVVVVV
jgi:hypothetical protein